MSNSVFTKVYAESYDLFYGEKNYEMECDVLEEVFKRYSGLEVASILDLGCGTGNHAIPLANRGYDVTGVDRSLEMLTQARKKMHLLKLFDVQSLKFLQGDICTIELSQKYDAILMMFAVLGYQYENSDVSSALQTAFRHCKKGGLFIFDVWYGPAVLAIRPSDRIKIITMENGQLIRAASGSLDTLRQQAKVQYHIWKILQDQVISESEEIHTMRYFFPQELAYFVNQAGFHLLALTSFPSLDQEPTEESWNVLAVCKAV